MPTVAGSPLLTALAQVPDFRQSQGKRHPLGAILALAVVAVLRGAGSLTAISQWSREHSPQVLAALGSTHFPGPCVATLHRVFSRLEVSVLEQILTAWLQTWLPCRGGLDWITKPCAVLRTTTRPRCNCWEPSYMLSG